MKTTKITSARVFATLLLAFVLAAPTLVQAGRGHHHHGHQGHRHHHGHNHNHHLNGYMMYNQPQPRIQYRSYYPQPSYNYYPAPVYIQPSMLGTGGTTFVIGF